MKPISLARVNGVAGPRYAHQFGKDTALMHFNGLLRFASAELVTF